MQTNDLIKMRRLELDMTMKELAKKVGVSEGTISRWESGDIANMRRDKIAALARALEVPPSVLMDWEEYDVDRIEKNKKAKNSIQVIMENLLNAVIFLTKKDMKELKMAINLSSVLEATATMKTKSKSLT